MSREPKIPVTVVDASTTNLHCDLPSGRQVAIRVDGEREQLVLVGLDGSVELQVVLTSDGPVLRMPTVRIALDGAEELSLEARRLRLRGTEEITVAGGEVHLESRADTRMKADGEVHVEGTMVYLN